MTDIATLSKPVLQRAFAQFMRQYETVRETQSALLDEIVRRNSGTAFGRDHGFRDIKAVADFRRNVPVRQWTELSPYADRVVAGEQQVLTADPPVMYHWTSGTTGTPKMIPVTRACGAATSTTLRAWLCKALLDNPKLLKGRAFALLNAGVDAYTDAGIPYGSISGNFYFRMPRLMRQAYSNSYDVYHIEDLASRHYTLLRFALEHDCSFLMSGNPAGFRAIFELGDRMSELLIRDIHDGTLSNRFKVPAHVRAAAISDLNPNPARARKLAKAKEQSGRLRPADYWPNLQVIACWLGGSMGHFAPALRDWAGEAFHYRDIGYMASEGVFSIPLDNDTPDSMLALHSSVFEFIPEAEFGRPDSTVLMAHELEAGQNYQVVLTTTGGLYRYAINDVVRVSEMRGNAPLIRFLYKGGNVQNLQGEMVSVDHVMAALNAAIGPLGVTLRHFQVLADLPARRYVLHLEPTETLSHETLTALLTVFEQELARQNVNYEYFRAHGYLKPPRLRVMREGWYARIMADHLSGGRTEAQFKPWVLVSKAQHIDMQVDEVTLASSPSTH
ncbi:MAG TPA: GH3 auxin-responsive promoter family protein [Alphaproteobacteria bacterium]|nr:GH3 auxin-responsive promoter family protein [Alphaproteobacteria bacterium]